MRPHVAGRVFLFMTLAFGILFCLFRWAQNGELKTDRGGIESASGVSESVSGRRGRAEASQGGEGLDLHRRGLKDGRGGGRGARGPVLMPFDPDRLQHDPEYRAVVWEHCIERDVQALRAAGLAEIDTIYALLAEQGVPRELAGELVRRAYEDVSEVRRFMDFAEDSLESAEKQRAAIAVEPDLPEDERKAWLQRHEEHGLVAKSHWLFMAERLKQLCVERFQRETGITDPGFYEELYALNPSIRAMPISMEMATNELVWTP